MASTSLARALAIAALGFLTLPAQAQDKSGPNLGPPGEEAASGGALTLVLAQELYGMGVAQGDVVTVLAAAKLAASVDVATAEPALLNPAKVTISDSGTNTALKAAPAALPAAPAPGLRDGTSRAAARASYFSATSEEDGAADAPVAADAMFAKAKELATGDDALLDLIDDTMAETGRGRIGRAVTWVSRLSAGRTDVWEIPFNGTSFAEIAIVGDGDANLDVVITDENANIICHDVSWSDQLYCDFTPAWDGYFYITVENAGGVRNSYYLMTN